MLESINAKINDVASDSEYIEHHSCQNSTWKVTYIYFTIPTR